jgi:hypothetical protein
MKWRRLELYASRTMSRTRCPERASEPGVPEDDELFGGQSAEREERGLLAMRNTVGSIS